MRELAEKGVDVETGVEMAKVVSRDGTEIAFERSGSGPPLVLVHGAAGDHERWSPILGQLQERFTVYAMDRRGRGGSGDGPEYSLEREFEDVAAVVDAIGEPASLLGHSLGGLCAIEASLLTRNLSRLVLHEPSVAVAAEVPPEVLARLEERLAEGDREGVVMDVVRDIVGMSEEEIELFRRQPAFAKRVASAHTVPRELRAGMSYRFEPERFASMQVPTLVLLGSESAPLDAFSAFTVHRALPSSRLVLMQGVEHVAILRDPDLVVREVVAFLSESATAAGPVG